MNTALLVAIDLVAILALVLGVYFPRHRRADLVVAFLGVNVAVLAVTMVLANSTVGAGLGLGLFGVLSIIRLRSSEISQREVAYYFASLAIGLLVGMAQAPNALTLGGIALILAVLAIGDSSLLFGRWGSQLVQLDRAIADESELRAALADRLGVDVVAQQVVKLDLVNDLTLVEVRYRRRAAADAHAGAASSAEAGRNVPDLGARPAASSVTGRAEETPTRLGRSAQSVIAEAGAGVPEGEHVSGGAR